MIGNMVTPIGASIAIHNDRFRGDASRARFPMTTIKVTIFTTISSIQRPSLINWVSGPIPLKGWLGNYHERAVGYEKLENYKYMFSYWLSCRRVCDIRLKRVVIPMRAMKAPRKRRRMPASAPASSRHWRPRVTTNSPTCRSIPSKAGFNSAALLIPATIRIRRKRLPSRWTVSRK